MTNKKLSKKIINRILAILLAFAMMVGTMPMTAQAISVVPFASDITNYVNVTRWVLLDSSGEPHSATNEALNALHTTFEFDWTIAPLSGQTLQGGDHFIFEVPQVQTATDLPNFAFPNLPWSNFEDSTGQIIGRWRIQSNQIEVELNANVTGSSSVSGRLNTSSIVRIESMVLGTYDVIFADITQRIAFGRREIVPMSTPPQIKTVQTHSSSQIRWVLDIHRNGTRELAGQGSGALGEGFNLVPGFFVEDTLNGEFADVQFVAVLHHPYCLNTGYVANASSLIHQLYDSRVPTPYITRIFPNADESRAAFRGRLEPFQWGIYEDVYGVQTFIAYFGTLGVDGPRINDLSPGFATEAAERTIESGLFPEIYRDALVAWYTAVYGDDNDIGGRVGFIRVVLRENFAPVAVATPITNTMIVNRMGVPTSSSVTGTLQPASGIGDPIPGGTARLWLVDQETSALLPNANFQLQIYENGDWVNVTVVGDNGIFTTDTDGSFTTPALGNGTFRFVQTTVSNAAYVLTNPLHNSYCPIEGIPVSPSFTLSGGAVGETVTVYNVRTGIQVPDLGIRKELLMPYGTTVPNATFEFDITLVSIFPTPPALTVVTIPNPTVTFSSTMTAVPHPDYPGYVYVHAYAPIDLSGITWTMPGVYRFRVTEMQNSGLASNPNYTIVYDPAVFYLYIYVGRESGDMTDPLEVLGYYVRHRVPTNACDNCEEDEYCATCGYAIIKEPVLMPFKNRLSRRPSTTSFEVRKEVTGRMGDTNLPFDFEVEMLLPGSAFPLSNTIEATITGYVRGVDGHITLPPTKVTVSSAIPISVDSITRLATHTFELRHGDVITFTNVPVGTTYVVTEDFVVGYDQSGVATEGGVAVSPPFTTTGDDDLVIEGTVSLPINETEVTNYVTVTNAHDGTPPMGVLLSNIPFGLMVALGAGALSLIAAAVIVNSKVKAKK